ncbi:hypothetical protein ACPWUB_02610 [Pasteurella sp. 22655_41Tandhals]
MSTLLHSKRVFLIDKKAVMCELSPKVELTFQQLLTVQIFYFLLASLIVALVFLLKITQPITQTFTLEKISVEYALIFY